MHVPLLLICCVFPGGGASTSASLKGSSDSKSPGRAPVAEAGPSSCNVWGGNRCAKKIAQCSADCNTNWCQKVKANCAEFDVMEAWSGTPICQLAIDFHSRLVY